MRYQLSQSLALLPSRSDSWIWISKPSKSCVKKFIGRRSASSCPLPVERPPKDELCGSIAFGGHPSKPMVYQRRFSHAGQSNDGGAVDTLVCPGTIRKSDIFLSTKNIASGNGQSGYGNLL